MEAMKFFSRLVPVSFIAAGLLGLAATAHAANQSEVDPWAAFLKPKYFPDVEFVEGESVISMTTPY
ncbi:MAG: hypothetical protein HKO62_02890, partial [Gammaproteobacteria bacterium]|nr:hypothetical protein [Gammaproteobacteria bacterium]